MLSCHWLKETVLFAVMDLFLVAREGLGRCCEPLGPKLRKQPIEKLAVISVEGVCGM